ncbi:MAG: nucleotide exchange factor GrpE [Clostridia bacterium]|nr:nucleotide exchange factor GrpE [Clostridia bacterium]
MDITNKKMGIIVTGIATFFFILIHNDLKGFKTMSEETKDVGVESTEVNESKKTKKSKDKKEIEELKAQLQETKDMLLRTAAEFDNYKKRETAAKEKLSTFVKGETLKAILPSLDNINRALSADESSADYAKGVSMTIKGLTDELKKLGLEEINPQGEEFDVNFHMAVMKVDDDSVGQNIVTEVLQTGYRLGDTLLRPAMVKVANCD